MIELAQTNFFFYNSEITAALLSEEQVESIDDMFFWSVQSSLPIVEGFLQRPTYYDNIVHNSTINSNYQISFLGVFPTKCQTHI